MKMRKSTLAAAVTTALTLGAAAPAMANIYGTSFLHIDNTTIVITESDGAGGTVPVPAGTFSFEGTNTATLNGSGDFQPDSCGGTFGGADDCGTTFDVLAANAPGGDAAATRSNNDFSFFGPGTLEYSNSDSFIPEAQLLGGTITETLQIAESELQTGSSAAANAELQSLTSFTFTFEISNTGSLVLDFDANPFMEMIINELTDGVYSAQTEMTATFSLQNEADTVDISWNPQGSPGTNNCDVNTGTATCSEDNDDLDLNQTRGIVSNPDTDTYNSIGAFGDFGITITGLEAGVYSLTLGTNVKTTLRRSPVPEPATIALFGLGLAGLGLGAIRRRKQA